MKKHMKFFLGLFLGIIVSGLTVYAATQIQAQNVMYNNKTVKEALDELYTLRSDGEYGTGIEHWDFSYEGKESEFVVPYTGKYKLEVWGAQGGSYSTVYFGGYGGYSRGVINLNKDSVLKINVGGQGQDGTEKNVDYSGGYNGGGNSYHWKNNNTYNSSGGGATHIATVSGTLDSLENNKESIIIVAGGGGGAYYATTTENALGGSGGGVIGVSGGNNTSSPNNGRSGLGGTQIAGGTYGGGNGVIAGSGSFGKGGNSSPSSTAGGSGGGGGYYGGSGSSVAGAGGGSGYIGKTNLTSKIMICYNCTTSNELSEKTLSTSCHQSLATEDCAKEENGYAKITYLGN